MDNSNQFILSHKKHIEETIKLLQSINKNSDISSIDKIAMATMLQNIYSGIENIIRNILLTREINVKKTEIWHKELLINAENAGIISMEMRALLLDYLAFRHYHIHGYGYMLKWSELKPLVDDISEVVQKFFNELAEKGLI